MSAVSGAIVIFMMCSIGLSVVMRYFFAKPIGWAQEISEYSLVCITFLSIAWVLRHEGHVMMDLLFNYLPAKAKGCLNTITSGICVVVCIILAESALKVVIKEYTLGYTTYSFLAPPKWIFTAVILTGFVILSLQFIRRTISCFISWRAELKTGTRG